MTDDDFIPKPVPPPRPVVPIGVAGNKPAGIQPTPQQDQNTQPYDQRPLPWVEAADRLSARSDRAKKAWETRRVKQAAHHLPDRHFTDEPPVPSHPFDAALAALYEQRQKIAQAIEALEGLK